MRDAGNEPQNLAAVKQPSAVPPWVRTGESLAAVCVDPHAAKQLLIHDPGRGVLRREDPAPIFPYSLAPVSNCHPS